MNNQDQQGINQPSITDRLSLPTNSCICYSVANRDEHMLNIDKECFNIYKVELREQVKHLEEIILPSIEGNDKYDRVKAVQRELWVLNGILEYGFKEEILNKISKKYERIGIVPPSYHQAELYAQAQQTPT